MTDTDEQYARLVGLNILMVEDEMVLAMSLQDLLEAIECRVAGAPTVEKALALIETERLDGALLDINLCGEPVYPVAEELDRCGIPFAFMTGYSASDVKPDWRDRPVLQKPFLLGDLEQVMAANFMPARR
jgi:DNA-binding response OmpR family regulator